jgi:hypothetical protein
VSFDSWCLLQRHDIAQRLKGLRERYLREQLRHEREYRRWVVEIYLREEQAPIGDLRKAASTRS